MVQRFEGVQGEAITQFDKDGKVLSFEQPEGRLEYSWSDDNSSVEIRGFVNGLLQGSQVVRISEMSASKYVYEIGGISYTVDWKSNGAVSKQTMTVNGQNQTTFFYYKRPEDFYPYKSVTSMGGQSMTTTIQVIETDSYGNLKKFSQTANGQTVITLLDIAYY